MTPAKSWSEFPPESINGRNPALYRKIKIFCSPTSDRKPLYRIENFSFTSSPHCQKGSSRCNRGFFARESVGRGNVASPDPGKKSKMAELAVWRRLDQRPALKVPDALPIRQRERAQLPRATVAPLKWFQAFNELVAPVSAAALVRPAAKILLNHWPRFIDCQRPAIVFRSVQFGDCLVGILVIHGHETQTLGSACVTIRNDADGFDCAIVE